MKRNFDQYREIQIKTASPGKLLLMLYDGAIRFLTLAIKSLEMEEKDLETAHNNIIKTQNIIIELTVTLDMDKGGEIAENLRNLYTFMKSHLIEANLKKEASYCIEVKELLVELRDSWREVVAKEENSIHNKVMPNQRINFKG